MPSIRRSFCQIKNADNRSFIKCLNLIASWISFSDRIRYNLGWFGPESRDSFSSSIIYNHINFDLSRFFLSFLHQ